MLRVILLRHAKSAWPESVDDHDRPLAPRGLVAAPLVGAYMAEAGLSPKTAIVSTARRTRETFEQLGIGHEGKVKFDDRLYAAAWTDLLAVIREQPAKASPLLLVGHNPGIATLASQLCDAMTSDGNALLRLTSKVPTAALIVIDFDLDSFAKIDREKGRLVSYTTPKMLGGVDED
jgi:phosphohistidine phosphatase